MINMKKFIAIFISLLFLFSLCSCECRHKWDGGEITKVSTGTEDGEILYTCSKCNETKTEKYHSQHTYSNNWGYDKNGHWLICDKQDCNVTTASGSHLFNNDNKCILCEYEK